jgi:hypothetical protein
MTVEELIKELQKCQQKATIYVKEGGYTYSPLLNQYGNIVIIEGEE